MSNIVSIQERFRPQLPTVVGNVDYKTLQSQLLQIDEILRLGGVERDFVVKSLDHWSKEMKIPLPKMKEKNRLTFQENSRKALRCNILRTLMGDSFRDFSCQLAGWPLLQWFCGVDQWGVVRVPAKSTLQRYSDWLPQEEMREVICGLLQGTSVSHDSLKLKQPLDIDSCFLDTTVVKTPIHFPVDWVLLRDAVRTLMKAVKLIRRQGLKYRMDEPGEFVKKMNRLCMQMTHVRRKKNARKEKKRVLRLMKKLVFVVEGHAQRYRNLLNNRWKETGYSHPQAEQILKRIDGILEQLPQAKKQAHERIIGEMTVNNKDKILSLYETDTNVIVRGKAGAEVEFGNTLLLAETRDGLIVDWQLWKKSAPADCCLLSDSLERVKKTLGIKIKNVGGDRGFDSAANRLHLVNNKIYNGICPRDPMQLKKQMKKDRFAWLQKRRSQTEGRIGIFKNQFLGRPLRVKGFTNRHMAVDWAVLTHNLWVIARLPQVESKQKAA